MFITSNYALNLCNTTSSSWKPCFLLVWALFGTSSGLWAWKFEFWL